MATKPSNGWARSSGRGGGGVGRSHRRNGGSYNQKYSRNNHGHSFHNNNRSSKSTFFENVNKRFLFTVRNAAGKRVIVKKKSGLVLEGTLIVTNQESVAGKMITLQFVVEKSRPKGCSEAKTDVGQKISIPWSDLDYLMTAKVSHNSARELKTDAEIARKNIEAGNLSGRNLQKADSSWLQKTTNRVNGNFSSNSKGTWDQFKANEIKFGVKNTYKEELYTTKLDKAALTPEQIKKAEVTAREIENKTSDNLHIREERNQKIDSNQDEEARYSSVSRPKHATAPNPPKTKPALSFAAALKGNIKAQNPPQEKQKLESLKAENSDLKTPSKPTYKSEVAKSSNSKPRAAKYSVSNINFKERWSKKLGTPKTKNWEEHHHTRSRLDATALKTKEEQINDFKAFSQKLESKHSPRKKVDSAKQLNVNAKEFKPPGRPEVVQVQQEGADQETTQTSSPGNPSSRQNSVTQQMPPQQNAQFIQPGMFPMPMPQFQGAYPIMHPVMLPPGQAPGNVPVFPHMVQNPQVVFPSVQGQYIVPMMPQQMQQQHFGQPRFVYNQMAPGVVPVPGNQQMHPQMQQQQQQQPQQQSDQTKSPQVMQRQPQQQQNKPSSSKKT